MGRWVKDWLDEQRAKGETCLEIKYIKGSPYVYRSTTKYDKEKKGPRKVTKYLGRLNEEHGFIARKEKTPKVSTQKIRTVKDYGNALLLEEEFKEMIPLLKEEFPDNWRQILAMVLTRVDGYIPLKRVKDKWDKLNTSENYPTNCDPNILSDVLKLVGSDSAAQQKIFSALAEGENQLIYDLSYVFSESKNLHIAEYGFTRKNVSLPQVNIALFSSIESGLPIMIRGMPGSIKDVKTLKKSLDFIDLKNKLLVMDRGFISDNLIPVFNERKIEYIQPLRRDSVHYSQRIHFTKHMNYHKRLIHCGKRKVDDYWIYAFRDTDLALDEEKTLYRNLDKEKITKTELRDELKKAGMMLIKSNHDTEPQEIYELYKSREGVEKHFEGFKSELGADKLYLRDSDAVYGHFFVAFLALYLYCRLIQKLKKAGLNKKYSPKDVTLKLSKVTKVYFDNRTMISEIPKQVEDLAEALELDIIPKT
jgi:transposase